MSILQITRIILGLLFLLPSIVFGQADGKVISNKASGGTISLDTILANSLLNIHQTTAGQTITIANLITGGRTIDLVNTGSVDVTIVPGGKLSPFPAENSRIQLRWAKTNWGVTSVGASTPVDTSLLVHKHTGDVLFSFPSSNEFQITTDNGAHGESWIDASSSSMRIGYDGSDITIGSNNILLENFLATITLNNANGLTLNDKRTGALQTGFEYTADFKSKFRDLTMVSKIYVDSIVSISSSGGLDTSLASGKILIGQSYGGAAAKTPSGEATISNAGVIALSNSAIIAKTLTGYSSAAGTITSSDNILQAVQKLDGNISAAINGLQIKQTATVATAASLPTNTYLLGIITITATGTLTVDGYVVALNDYVLVKNEVTQANNGLYKCTTAGAIGVQAVLTRATDMNTASEFSGAFIPVSYQGTLNANSLWLCNPVGTVTVGVTAIPFTQLNGATDLIAGSGINITGNTISIPSSGVVNTMIASMTSAQLAGIVSDETGTGNAVFSDSPTFTGSPIVPTQSVGDNSTKIASTAYADAIAALFNRAYVALVDGATINIPFFSVGCANYTLSSNRTATTFTISNDANAAEAYIIYSKTTASNLVLTFPSNTILTDQNGAEVVGLAVTLTSTSSGLFEIFLKKSATGYMAIIKRTVA